MALISMRQLLDHAAEHGYGEDEAVEKGLEEKAEEYRDSDVAVP